MTRLLGYVLIMSIVLFILTGCGSGPDDSVARNIEQIHQAEGIPVRVETVTLKSFKLSLSYNSNLSGIKETTLTSLVADRVERISVSVGDYVEKDQMLLTFPEDTPSAQFLQAKAAYENTEKTYERMSSLFDQGGISRQELDQLGTARRVSEANFRTSEKLVKIRAPFAGFVSQINLRETESAGMGDPLITVVRVDKYQAKIWVTENDIFSVKPGLEVVARWQSYELPGRVVQVSRSIDRSRQAFPVDIEFDNPNDFLLSGVMASVELIIYDNPQSIIIPRQFILSDSEGSFVYLAEQDRAIKRYVTIGENDGINYEVSDGISVGDILIREGANQVTPETRIRIIE